MCGNFFKTPHIKSKSKWKSSSRRRISDAITSRCGTTDYSSTKMLTSELGWLYQAWTSMTLLN